MNIEDLGANEVLVSGGSNRSNKIYHTTNCDRHPANPRAMDRTMAEAWGFVQCKFCAGGGPSETGRDVDYSYQNALKEAAQND